MKRVSLYLLFAILLIGPVSAESINLSTFYPAPFGAYDRFRLVPRAGAPSACDGSTIGMMYVDNVTNLLNFCDGVDYNLITTNWTHNTTLDYIYPTKTTAIPGLLIGIGTETPAEKLDVLGNINIDIDSAYFIDGTHMLSRPGWQNTLIGKDAGKKYIAFTNSVIIGHTAGQNLESSVGNTIIGSMAGGANVSGGNNTIIGFSAGATNTASNNIYIGSNSGLLSTAATGNVFVGVSTGLFNTGGNNTFIGYAAGKENTTANSNTFIGHFSGLESTTGEFNTFVGDKAGHGVAGFTTGGSNTFIGYVAGEDNTTGIENTFVGARAGRDNTTGTGNTFLGQESGKSNTTGAANTFLGFETGALNTTGASNTLVGYLAGGANIGGSGNTFVGQTAGLFHTSGTDNTFVGRRSGYKNDNGTKNTMIGFEAGFENLIGVNNVFIGAHAGGLELGDEKLYIDNTNIATPLIYGEFDNDVLIFNGILGILTAGAPGTYDSTATSLDVNGFAAANDVWLKDAGAWASAPDIPRYDSGWFFLSSGLKYINKVHGLTPRPWHVEIVSCGKVTVLGTAGKCLTHSPMVGVNSNLSGGAVNPVQVYTNNTHIVIGITTWWIWGIWGPGGGGNWTCPGDADANCNTGYYRVYAW